MNSSTAWMPVVTSRARCRARRSAECDQGRGRVPDGRGIIKAIVNAVVCFTMLGGGFAASAGQKTGPISPPPVVESIYGPDLYRHYCATCHGRDGKGDGPAGGALKARPSDLTVLARRNKGTFPASTVATIIRGGTTIAAHGSVEMPVWGPIFYALDPSDAHVRARIAALVSHIATIQQK